MGYSIVILPSAEKQIKKLPPLINAKILKAISALSGNPRPNGYKKLKGINAYRIRVGDYRIIYEIQDDRLIIIIIAAGNRKDIYKW